jgi:hypothetical protein
MHRGRGFTAAIIGDVNLHTEDFEAGAILPAEAGQLGTRSPITQTPRSRGAAGAGALASLSEAVVDRVAGSAAITGSQSRPTRCPSCSISA